MLQHRGPSPLLLLLVAGHLASATFRILDPDNLFYNVPIYSPPRHYNLGPQANDPGLKEIRGRLLISLSDECGDVADSVRGRVVLSTGGKGHCHFGDIYANFNAKGALALISVYAGMYTVPSVGYYGRFFDPIEDFDRTQPMLCLYVQETRINGQLLSAYIATHGSNVTVEVSVDTNAYVMMQGVNYQLFVRWLPTTLFLFNAMAAIVFLRSRLLLIYQRDCKARRKFAIDQHALSVETTWTPIELQPTFRELLALCGVSEGILCIEGPTCALLSWYIGVGGYFSTPNLSYPVNRFFGMSGLSGVGFTSDILAATFLADRIHELMHDQVPQTRLTRLMKYSPRCRPVLLVVPFVLDTTFSLIYALDIKIPYIEKMIGAFLTIIQLIVGHSFLSQFATYHEIATTGTTAIASTGIESPDAVTSPQTKWRKTIAIMKVNKIDWYIKRLRRWTRRLGVSIIAYVVATSIAATPFVFTPNGWFMFAVAACFGRAASSTCRIMMQRHTQPSQAEIARMWCLNPQTPIDNHV